ncbi:MAG: hypothetical protein WCH86_02375 [Kiritimatiellales bacterium]
MKKLALVFLVLTAFPAFGQSGIFNPFSSRDVSRLGLLTQSNAATVRVGAQPVVSGYLYLLSTNGWEIASATNSACSRGVIGLAVGTNSGQGITFSGMVQTTNAISAGHVLFLSDIPGEFTSAQPTNSGYVVRMIGQALSTNTMLLWQEIGIQLR